MAIKLLIVDDSGFFRRRVVEILQGLSDLQIVGTAANGKDAIDLVAKLKPDVITMDYEMPVMDGITAVRHIMQANPTPVLMFSSLTYEGARVTFDALDAGAVDFLPKSFEAMSGDGTKIKKLLHERIVAVAQSRPGSRPGSVPSSSANQASQPSHSSPGVRQPQARDKPLVNTQSAASLTPARSALTRKSAHTSQQASVSSRSVAAHDSLKTAARADPPGRAVKLRRQDFGLVAIGTSTGGPVALQKILTHLPGSFPRPIVLVQHMPATFTPAFAERLDKLSRISVKQAEHGEILKPATAYVAPGGKQMLIERAGNQGRIKILEGDNRLHYKPCVDVTFGSAAKVFPGKVLGIVLTGMGADGREGCRMLKDSGSQVWSQDEQSSVIFGMPMAVIKAGLADQVFSLGEFSSRLVDVVA